MIKTIYIVKYEASQVPSPVKEYLGNYYNISYCENLETKIRFLQDNSPFDIKFIWHAKCFYYKEVKKWIQQMLIPYYHKANWYQIPHDKIFTLIKGMDNKISQLNANYLIENQRMIK